MADSLAATDDEYDIDITDIEWSMLGHVFLFGNYKGGVGKSTLAANAGGLLAQAGHRTLIVDLNAQGNVALDLGVWRKQDLDDNGRSLFLALTADEPLKPVKNVRPGLDLLFGGDYIRKIPAALSPSMSSKESAAEALLSLAYALVRIAHEYDVILIDSPPENELLVQLALCAARFVVVPMKTDQASRIGLRQLASNFRSMRGHNPFLILLGVAVFASGSSATKARKELRDDVAADLKGGAPVFEAFVRHAEAVGVASRKYGLLAHELEMKLKKNPKFGEIRDDDGSTNFVVPATAQGVATDLDLLVGEIFRRAQDKKNELQQKGYWP